MLQTERCEILVELDLAQLGRGSMKKYFIGVIAVASFIFNSSSVCAFESYYTHWWTPYPPSCVFTLTLPRDVYTMGEGQLLISETISLGSSDNAFSAVSVEIEVIRRSCTEENRSALFMIFRNPTELHYKAPKLSARIGDDSYQLRLSREPNTRFEDYASKTIDSNAMFIIDGADFSVVENAISADQYNGAFRLVVEDSGGTGNVFEYDLPANNPNLKPHRKLLTGRMSGTWVAEGTTDQGFQLSIQELWTSGSPEPHAFLSWYTFDNDGNMLWLTGAGIFGVMGDSGVTLNMELVTNGEFLGNKKADRLQLHEAYLFAESCNRLGFRYDLEELGLGKGSIYLKRIFSLETAGYTCRDTQSKLDTLSD